MAAAKRCEVDRFEQSVSTYFCLSVCLSVKEHIVAQETHVVQATLNFLRSVFSGGVAVFIILSHFF